MPTLIDTSLWIDFTRTRSPRKLKQFIAPFILDSDAHLAEPITFEILRHATPSEARQLTRLTELSLSYALPHDARAVAVRAERVDASISLADKQLCADARKVTSKKHATSRKMRTLNLLCKAKRFSAFISYEATPGIPLTLYDAFCELRAVR